MTLNFFLHIIYRLYFIALILFFAPLLIYAVYSKEFIDGVFALCVIYIVGGIGGILWAGSAFKKKLDKSVNAFASKLAGGFTESFGVRSYLLDQYIGFDNKSRKCLYFKRGNGKIIAFDQIVTWGITPGYPSRFYITTTVPDLTVIEFSIPSGQAAPLLSNLQAYLK